MRSQIIILNFHGIGQLTRPVTQGEDDCWISKTFFEEVLDYISGRNDVELTFDDSNESDYEVALPALKARNLTARFFVVANRIDQPCFLSSGQIRSIQAEGMKIGSHGARHLPWSKCGAEELDEELIAARKRLEDVVGAPVIEAACPFGVYNRRVLNKLRHVGYERVYTSDGGPALTDCWIRPRNTVLKSYALATVRPLVEYRPHGLRKWWREAKLCVKRWR
jgi:peptidoglycan/xylan/chitin deacetylase (PgdA/CDA1 family)